MTRTSLHHSAAVFMGVVLSFLVAGCGGERLSVRSGSDEVRSQPPAQPVLRFQAPVVYMLTSSALCRGHRANEISDQVAADREGFLKVFPKAIELHAERFDAEDVAPPPAEFVKDQPVVFFYSGHGVSRRNDRGEMESHVCLPKGEVGFPKLARWVRARAGNGSVIVLNSCESANVDPSVDGLGAMSVMSASLDVTMDASPDRPGSGTPVAAGLVSLLDGTSLEDADLNCDRLVTDRELFDALENELRARSWRALSAAAETQIGVPVPKFRSNMDEPLVLLRLDAPPTSERCQAILQDFEGASSRLPLVADLMRRPAPTDYFVVTDRHEKIRSARSCDELEQEWAIVCRTFGMELDLLALPQEAKIEDVSSLARISSSTQVYGVKVDLPWVEVVRLRDGMTTTVATVDQLATAVPARRRTLQRVPDGSVRRLYFGKVCPERLARFGPRAVPCSVSSGQCFWLNKEPVGSEDACK